jgi:tetraacyldisaccharide 4'-kinase
MTPWKHPLLVRLLSPFSVLYRLVTSLRNCLYDRGLLASFRVPARIISVGNITVGGTGKTPLVETLARFFAGQGQRVAVVSRGYGRKGKNTVVVSDGNTVLSDPDITGDEPLLLARHLKGIPVLVGTDRVAASREAVRLFGSTLIVLDDGFQHRRLKRDLDVVTLRRGDPFGNGLLLPAGPLRESLKGLRRADVIVLTGIEGSPESADRRWICDLKPGKVVEANYRPGSWNRFSEDKSFPLETFGGKTVFAFSGIGNPESFEKSLQATGVNTAGHRVFRDHHRYTAGEWRQIGESAEALGAVAVVTTEKDAVRSRLSWEASIPLYYLTVEISIAGGNELLRRLLTA